MQRYGVRVVRLDPVGLHGVTSKVVSLTIEGKAIMQEQIAKEQWADFLKDFDRQHQGNEARIEIMGRELGDQEEADWLPLSGISYDTHRDQIIVSVGGMSSRYPAHLTHMISEPTQVMVTEHPEGVLDAILIVASDETKTLVHFRHPLELTA